MVKVKGPLFSLGARGSLGKAISYRGQPFGAQVEKKPKKRDFKSGSQLARRGLFLDAVAYWNGLSAEEKAEYNGLAAGLPMTGFNLCVRDYLMGVIELGFDVEEGGEVKVAGATKVNFLGGFGVADEGDGRAGISHDVDEAPLSGLGKLAGRSGGQTFVGGTGAGEHLTLQSTAHATRGYVRAQDDLQLLSNKLLDSGGSERVRLAASGPHVTLFDHVKVGTRLDVIGAPTNVGFLNVQPGGGQSGNQRGLSVGGSSWADSGGFDAVFGYAQVSIASGKTMAARGLYFLGQAVGAGAFSSLTACRAELGSIAGPSGGFTEAAVFDAGAAAWWGQVPGSVYGLRVGDQGAAGIAEVYGVKVVNMTLGTERRLLEIGPATPFLRVVGGADPAAGFSNVYVKVGGTLYQVRTRAIGGYTCLTID